MTRRLFCILMAGLTLIMMFSCAKNNNNGGYTTVSDTNKVSSFDYVPSEAYKWADKVAPIFAGNTIYDEHVMFVSTDDKVSLLYEPTEIISVKTTDGKTTFVEGVDYALENGKLVMPEGSSLTYIPEDIYWNKGVYDVYTMKNGEPHITYSAGWDGMAKYQVAVTYKHNGTFPFEVPDCSEQYAYLIEKLEKGEDVTFLFFGDSITEGWDNSLRCGYDPLMPPWTALFTQYVAHKYGYIVKYISSRLDQTYTYPLGAEGFGGERGIITYINVGRGGWNSSDGVKNVQEYVIDFVEKYGCDLYVHAFGMNNIGIFLTSKIGTDTEAIVNKVLKAAPEASIMVVSSMLPNPDWDGGTTKIEMQENNLKETVQMFQDEGHSIALSPMQSVSKAIMAVKRFQDHSGNNMNHPGDYGHRVYAQVALQTLLGYAD